MLRMTRETGETEYETGRSGWKHEVSLGKSGRDNGRSAVYRKQWHGHSPMWQTHHMQCIVLAYHDKLLCTAFWHDNTVQVQKLFACNNTDMIMVTRTTKSRYKEWMIRVFKFIKCLNDWTRHDEQPLFYSHGSPDISEWGRIKSTIVCLIEYIQLHMHTVSRIITK